MVLPLGVYLCLPLWIFDFDEWGYLLNPAYVEAWQEAQRFHASDMDEEAYAAAFPDRYRAYRESWPILHANTELWNHLDGTRPLRRGPALLVEADAVVYDSGMTFIARRSWHTLYWWLGWLG